MRHHVCHRFEERMRRGSLSTRLGTLLPLERSASGRVFLAFLDEADGGVRRSLAAVVERVRADRMAATDGLLNAGFAALSVSIFDHLGELAGAMTTLGPAGHLDTSPEGRTCTALRVAGESASEALGHRPGTAAT